MLIILNFYETTRHTKEDKSNKIIRKNKKGKNPNFVMNFNLDFANNKSQM